MSIETRTTALIALTLAGCGGATHVDSGAPTATGVVINELMSSNTSGLEDHGTYPDWIELHNLGSAPADLTGHWLSDDADEPNRWQLPDGVVIEPTGFLLIIADNDPEEGALHATFQLDQLGEDVVLTGPEAAGGPILDLLEDYRALASDVSLARAPNGGAGWAEDPTPTPGAAN